MNAETPQPDAANKNLTQVIYGLYAATLILTVTVLIAVVINYVKRDDVRGTWLESHFDWQIRTFWWSLLWGVIGIITLPLFGFGLLILIPATIWYIYRIVKGWLRLSENKPMDA